MERRSSPAGNLDLSGDSDDDKRIEVDADVPPRLEVPRREFGRARAGGAEAG